MNSEKKGTKSLEMTTVYGSKITALGRSGGHTLSSGG